MFDLHKKVQPNEVIVGWYAEAADHVASEPGSDRRGRRKDGEGVGRRHRLRGGGARRQATRRSGNRALPPRTDQQRPADGRDGNRHPPHLSHERPAHGYLPLQPNQDPAPSQRKTYYGSVREDKVRSFHARKKKSFGAIHFLAIVELVEYLQSILEKKNF